MKIIPPENPKEGEVINFTISVFDFPQGYNLSFDTELVSYDDNPIYNITTINKQVYGRNFEINTTGHDIITIHMVGKVPKITEVKQYEEITLKKYSKTTGYTYYRIELFDKEGTIIDTNTQPFTIDVSEIEFFNNKLSKIHDGWIRNYLQGLHDKGLVNEANELADHWIDNKKIPVLWFFISLIGVAIIFFIIGIRIGYRREEL
ncbi:MAG: hypothetical protein K8R25_17015 [Methanosarcinales archaeon]|nr:hypothetical protein [Methanosarcinales archaeon]